MATKTNTDPAQAILDRIEELQDSIKPQRDKIAEIEAKAKADVDQVKAEMRDTEEEIDRLDLAAKALRGELPKVGATRRSSGTRAARGSLPALNVTEKQVLDFLAKQSEPVSAGDIRAHFDVPSEISSKLSVLLGGLADTDQIKREGERRGTRYSAK